MLSRPSRLQHCVNGAMQDTSCRQSCALLEERDYIGLSEALSAIDSRSKNDTGSLLKDTDLRPDLELGLALGSGGENEGLVTQSAKEILRKRPFLTQRTPMKLMASEIGIKQSCMQDFSHDSAADYHPASKDQIVGWPPVRLSRQILSKPAEMFVKVNMDGMTIGRKVDLSAYGSYKGLLHALEEMFRPPGRDSDMSHFLLSKEPDYVLTYEDKEGDWMLVGDVPWSLFTATVRRFRITRVSEAKASGTWGQLVG